MQCIKIIVILSVWAFYLAIMTKCVWLNELVLYHTLFESQTVCDRVLRTSQSLDKFLTVIGLNALNREFECPEHMLKKNDWRITAVFLKRFKIPVSWILVDRCVPIEFSFLCFCITHDTRRRNKLNIYLNYPIFAICLYNLVPACPACNHIKGTQDIGVSPYDHSLNFDKLKISYIPKSSNWINDSKEIDISFKYDKLSEFGNKIKRNLTVLELEEAYKNHTDYVQEILKKLDI